MLDIIHAIMLAIAQLPKMPKKFFFFFFFSLFLNFSLVLADQENIIVTGVPKNLKSFTKVEANIDCPSDSKFCQITLNCIDSESCANAKIYFCVDQEDNCQPRILYTGLFQLGREGKKYLRYYSIAKTEVPTPIQEEKQEKPVSTEIPTPSPKPSIFSQFLSFLKKIFESIKTFFKST